jgi:ABC-type branched-subunit amino acid transport system ATPase component
LVFEFDNIELYFKSKSILSGIYLKAEVGKTTAILGSNGCEKSCLLNIVFGNLKSKYKLVRLDNKPILKPLYKTGLVKFLPQYLFIPNGMRLPNIFKLYDLNWEAFISKFESFSKYRGEKIGHLSGGERRIVETYIILKSKSKLVLLDEPFSHIAPIFLEHIKQIISEEKKHKAIIITDHLYEHIIDAADSIYLLKNGTTKKIEHLAELEDYKYISQL